MKDTLGKANGLMVNLGRSRSSRADSPKSISQPIEQFRLDTDLTLHSRLPPARVAVQNDRRSLTRSCGRQRARVLPRTPERFSVSNRTVLAGASFVFLPRRESLTALK